MTFAEFQKNAKKTAKYPDVGSNYLYPTLGLVNEAGEVAGKIKKIQRDHDNILTDEVRQNIAGEMGDVLWYVATLATELGLSLDQLAKANQEKLLSRLDRGVLHGSGDNR